VAREIILRNGFADRVRLVAKHSSDLAVGVDLVRPADVMVSEIISNNMVGEGVLQAVEQTVRRLTQPKAQIIPARGVIRIALAEDRRAHRHQMARVEGFDLSPFNRLASACYPIKVGDDRLMLRSEPGDLFRFDFQSGGPFPESRAVAPLLTDGGRVNGIAQWIRLEMDDEINYENSPAAGTTSAWDVLFYPLMRPTECAAGEIFTVHGAHDRATLRVWAEVPQLP
jgi:type II protein arginine methyltransferase